MTFFAKILGSTLAATVLGTALVGGGTAFAASSAPSHPAAAQDGSGDRVDRAALDAFRQVVDGMVADHTMTAEQRHDVFGAARRADWDGFSVDRLGDILGDLLAKGKITQAQRDAILDAVAHADRNVERLNAVLDRLVDRGVLSRDQRDAVIDACHRSDWDGFSIERIGDILGGLVQRGVLSATQRDAIMDGMSTR